jgi:hypothetical protein
MWNNRSSYFLLIQIRHQMVNITLPIPLFVLEDVLVALNDFGLLWGSFFPRQKLPSLITTLCLELFQELRRFGSWRFVEVSAGESQVSIKYY